MFRFGIILAVLLLVSTAMGLPKYAEETGQKCESCHTDPSTGELNDAGRAFSITHKWPPEKIVDERLFFALGSLHLFSAVLWIGAIFFVHLVHTPDIVALGGAPRKELVLGWTGIFGTGFSGALMTYYRFGSFENLLQSESGRIVLAKILIYLFMVFTALTLTFYLNRKFKASRIFPGVDISSLEKFDSLEKGKRVLVTVGGLVFDLSDSPMWKDGKHAGKHEAWRDLTEEIRESPHGIGILKKYKPVGYTGDFLKLVREIRSAIAVFKLFAYTNLLLGILAIVLSAYIRWMV